MKNLKLLFATATPFATSSEGTFRLFSKPLRRLSFRFALMPKQPVKPAITAVMALAFVALLVTGCGDPKVDSKHTSSQRYYLEKLILTENDLGEQYRLQQRLIIAHNGYGMVDVGSLVLGNEVTPSSKEKEKEKTEEEEAFSSHQKLIAWLPSLEKEGDEKNEATTLSMMRQLNSVNGLSSMVRPKGNLEGYAEMTFVRRSEPALSSADVTPAVKTEGTTSPILTGESPVVTPEYAGESKPSGAAAESPSTQVEAAPMANSETLKIQYFMSHYPVDYLQAVTASPEDSTKNLSDEEDTASDPDEDNDGERETGKPNDPADNPANVAEKGGEGGKTVANQPATAEVKPTESVPLLPIIIQSSESSKGTGSLVILIQAKGLRVLLSSPKKDSQLAKACTEEIVRRICREIDTNHSVLQEIRNESEELTLHTRLGAFWNHLGNRIDVDDMTYQFFKGKF